LEPLRVRFILLAIFFALACGLASVYGYAYIHVLPRIGFGFNALTGEIVSVPAPGSGPAGLQVHDRILSISGVPYREFASVSGPSILSLLSPDNRLRLTIERGQQTIEVDWAAAPLTPTQTLVRLFRLLPGAIIVVFGFLFLAFMNPRDARWAILTPACSVTSVWLAAGLVARYNLYGSPLALRVAIWLCIALYLRIGWLFPTPLKRFPRPFTGLVYLAASALAAAEILRLLPAAAYLVGFLVATVGCLALLLVHAWYHPAEVQDVRRIVFFFSLILFPSLLVAVFSGRLDKLAPTNLSAFALPGAPLIILYTVFRRRLGAHELFVNQVTTLFLYFIVLLNGAQLAVDLIPGLLPLREGEPLAATALALVLGIGGALFYPRFARWTQTRLLGIPLLPDRLLSSFAGKIAASLEGARLRQLLLGEVFPALRLRQAALLRLDEALNPVPFALYNITPASMPTPGEISSLLRSSRRYRLPAGPAAEIPCSWARLALDLRVEGRAIGVCLFGEREADDFYSLIEIPALVSLMDQAALALHNIAQAERLHSLHQSNIERQEAERAALARELHDEVLGQMALLTMNLPGLRPEDPVRQACDQAADHIRGLIHGLRPTMIQYGLGYALQELADERMTGSPHPPCIRLELLQSDGRYPPEFEMHVYRIVQQSCQNALQHGQARTIVISGSLAPGQVELCVADDGVGFEASGPLDLAGLLARRHFGLASMHERAFLIGAILQIQSRPGAGTRVSLTWPAHDRPDLPGQAPARPA
jgi:signal transduction histidine kinase